MLGKSHHYYIHHVHLLQWKYLIQRRMFCLHNLPLFFLPGILSPKTLSIYLLLLLSLLLLLLLLLLLFVVVVIIIIIIIYPQDNLLTLAYTQDALALLLKMWALIPVSVKCQVNIGILSTLTRYSSGQSGMR